MRTALALLLTTALVALGCRADARPHHHAPVLAPAAPSTSVTPRAGSATPTTSAVELPPPAQGDPRVETSVHCALGCPVATHAGNDYPIVRGQYVVAYSPSHRVPSWAAWRLTPADYGGTERHAGQFLTDDTLPAGWYRVTHADYSGSGYDRGHLVDSADRSSSRAANDATFFLTNVAPQRPDLNRGPWLRLEEDCRKRARHDGRTVFVVAGPVWGDATPQTLKSGVAVPVAFWKVAVVLPPTWTAADVGPSTLVLAAIMPNQEGIHANGWRRYEATLAAVEKAAEYGLVGHVRAALGAR